MKTAVERLIEQLEGEDSKIARVIGLKKYNSIIKEALQEEKEQMGKFYGKLQVDENNLVIDFENYYNQTFKQQQ